MTATQTAWVCAASVLFLAGCDMSKTFTPIESPEPALAANGTWMLQTRILESACESTEGKSMVISVVQNGGSAQIFLDADGDGSFAELIQLPASISGSRLRALGQYENGGWMHHVDLTLEGIVWGSMTGRLELETTPIAGQADPMSGCVTSEAVTAIKIGNPPQFDLSGGWDVAQTTAFATGPLQALTGSTTDLGWKIRQDSDPFLRGVFTIGSSDDREYLGVVNDSQIIVGGTFTAYGYDFHVTYSTLNAHDDDMSGQLLAKYGPNKEFEIGWNIVAHRPYGVGNGSTLQLSSSTDQSVTLVDSRGGVHSLQLHAGDEARVRVPAGLTRLMSGSKQETLLLEPQTRAALSLQQ